MANEPALTGPTMSPEELEVYLASSEGTSSDPYVPADPRPLSDEELNKSSGPPADPRPLSDEELNFGPKESSDGDWTARNLGKAAGSAALGIGTNLADINSGVSEGVLGLVGLPNDLINLGSQLITGKRVLAGSPEMIAWGRRNGLLYKKEDANALQRGSRKAYEVIGSGVGAATALKSFATMLRNGKYIPQVVTEARTVFQRLMNEAATNPNLLSQELGAAFGAGTAVGTLEAVAKDAPWWVQMFAELTGGVIGGRTPKPGPRTPEGQREIVGKTLADLAAPRSDVGPNGEPLADNIAGLQDQMSTGRDLMTNPDGTPLVEGFDPTTAQMAVSPSLAPDGSKIQTRPLAPFEKAELAGSPEIQNKLEGQSRAISAAADESFQTPPENTLDFDIDPSDAGVTIREDLTGAQTAQADRVTAAYDKLDETITGPVGDLFDTVAKIKHGTTEADLPKHMPEEVIDLMETFRAVWPEGVKIGAKTLSFDDFVALRAEALRSQDPDLSRQTSLILKTVLQPEKQLGILKAWRTRVLGERYGQPGPKGALKGRLGELHGAIESAIDSFAPLGTNIRAVDDFRAASAEARSLKEVFESGEVGETLRKEWGDFALRQSDVPGKFTSAQRQPESWEALVKATGDPSKATQAARRIIQQRWNKATTNARMLPEGQPVVSSSKMENFLANPDNKELLKSAFGQAHVDRLAELARMARIRESILTSPGVGGSNTAEKIKALETLQAGKNIDRMFASLVLRWGFVARAGRVATQAMYANANIAMDQMFRDAMTDSKFASELVAEAGTAAARRGQQRFQTYTADLVAEGNAAREVEDNAEVDGILESLAKEDRESERKAQSVTRPPGYAGGGIVRKLGTKMFSGTRPGYGIGGILKAGAKKAGAKMFSGLEKAAEAADSSLRATISEWKDYLGKNAKKEEIDLVWPDAETLIRNPGPDEFYEDPMQLYSRDQVAAGIKEANKNYQILEFDTGNPLTRENLVITPESIQSSIPSFNERPAFSVTAQDGSMSPLGILGVPSGTPGRHRYMTHSDGRDVRMSFQDFENTLGEDLPNEFVEEFLSAENKTRELKYGPEEIARLEGGIPGSYVERVFGHPAADRFKLGSAHFADTPGIGDNNLGWALFHGREESTIPGDFDIQLPDETTFQILDPSGNTVGNYDNLNMTEGRVRSLNNTLGRDREQATRGGYEVFNPRTGRVEDTTHATAEEARIEAARLSEGQELFDWGPVGENDVSVDGGPLVTDITELATPAARFAARQADRVAQGAEITQELGNRNPAVFSGLEDELTERQRNALNAANEQYSNQVNYGDGPMSLFVDTNAGVSISNPYVIEPLDTPIEFPISYWRDRGIPRQEIVDAMDDFISIYAPRNYEALVDQTVPRVRQGNLRSEDVIINDPLIPGGPGRISVPDREHLGQEYRMFIERTEAGEHPLPQISADEHDILFRGEDELTLEEVNQATWLQNFSQRHEVTERLEAYGDTLTPEELSNLSDDYASLMETRDSILDIMPEYYNPHLRHEQQAALPAPAQTTTGLNFQGLERADLEDVQEAQLDLAEQYFADIDANTAGSAYTRFTDILDDIVGGHEVDMSGLTNRTQYAIRDTEAAITQYNAYIDDGMATAIPELPVTFRDRIDLAMAEASGYGDNLPIPQLRATDPTSIVVPSIDDLPPIPAVQFLDDELYDWLELNEIDGLADNIYSLYRDLDPQTDRGLYWGAYLDNLMDRREMAIQADEIGITANDLMPGSPRRGAIRGYLEEYAPLQARAEELSRMSPDEWAILEETPRWDPAREGMATETRIPTERSVARRSSELTTPSTPTGAARRAGTQYTMQKTVVPGKLLKGSKITHIDEIQSDRFQKANTEGGNMATSQAELNRTDEEYQNLIKSILGAAAENNVVMSRNKLMNTTTPSDLTELSRDADIPEETMNRFAELQTIHHNTGGVPFAPYQKSFPLLVFKRMLIQAAEDGSDWLTWNNSNSMRSHHTGTGIAKSLYDKQLRSHARNLAKKHFKEFGTPDELVQELNMPKAGPLAQPPKVEMVGLPQKDIDGLRAFLGPNRDDIDPNFVSSVFGKHAAGDEKKIQGVIEDALTYDENQRLNRIVAKLNVGLDELDHISTHEGSTFNEDDAFDKMFEASREIEDFLFITPKLKAGAKKPKKQTNTLIERIFGAPHRPRSGNTWGFRLTPKMRKWINDNGFSTFAMMGGVSAAEVEAFMKDQGMVKDDRSI